LARKFLTQLAIKWRFSFPPHPTSASTLPGENRTNEICIKMNNKRQQMEITSHKNMTTVVWANEVHRLLTTVLLVKQRTVTRLADVRVSAGQCIARTERSNCWSAKLQTSSLRICGPPTALTSIRSITSSGGHATAGLSDDVHECGWTQEATGWHLDWSGAEHYWHCYQRMEKPSWVLVFAPRADILNIYC